MSLSTLMMPGTPELFDVATVAEDELYEIVNGRRIKVAPMSAYAAKVASRLSRKLGDLADDRGLGEVIVEGLFRIPLDEDRKRNRRPDVAFVSFERWPAAKPQPQRDNAWDVVPDLAIEVISPTDSFEDVMAKVAEYFRGGVRLVWVVLPVVRRILVFDSPTAIRVVTDTESLDGAEVVPGFLLPLANLLDPPQPAAPAE
jgi:Uma2 family endonuclease